MSRAHAGLIERTVESLAGALEHARLCEDTAGAAGLLQGLDARVKLCGMLALIVTAVAARRLEATAGVMVLGAVLAQCSGITVRMLAVRTWLGVLVFTGLIAVPAIFLTPGEAVAAHWPGTRQGLMAAARLVLRAETAATLASVLVLTTPWAHVLKGLRMLRMPAVVVMVLGMTYRYIFLLLLVAEDFFEARRSRLLRSLSRREQRRMAGAAAGVLLGKSLQLSEEVYQAMQARGYRGEALTMNDFRMRTRDWVAAGGFSAAVALALWGGMR
jgi:cobalt/nickel transport system permease protein